MAGNSDPQRRPVLYDLKNQRLLADPAIGSKLIAVNPAGTFLTPSDIGVTVQGYDSTLLNATDIGVSVQGYDPTLLNAADIGISVQGYDPTLLNTADIGVSVQGYDANLAAIGGLTSAADSLPYYTGPGTAALTTITASGRALLDDASASDMRVTLGVDAAYTITTTATSKTLVNRERCSVTTAGQTLTLPASPQAGWEVSVTIAGNFTSTVVARNGANIMSLAEDLTVDRPEITLTLLYVDATRGWRII